MPLKHLSSLICLSCLICLGVCRTVAAEELIVSGAASLINAMAEIKTAFENANPQWQVFANFAGSGQLLQQIEAGAPVDVFVPADRETMDRAQKAGFIDEASRVDFTGNDLMLVVPIDAVDINSLSDLANPRVGRVALGEPDAVPAGSYTKQVLVKAGLWQQLEAKMVYGLSVKQALDYVALGEVDAAFVYATDARLASRKVRVVANMTGHNPIIYPVALLKSCVHQEAARAFLTFLQSSAGQAIMRQCGFKQLDAAPNKN
ncbi:molybdate ABC transporter substrate-binding protein [Desulfovibrio sp. TomC]|uniref:molybdate ABC transporter substrate-binding protein n=1 Tax=Desulfovibrio sp. TomC TaxID=1562888 RepID=UPI000575BE6A|nr:molybdate ABC transporter substrate-binding protein [Desulfovibrio sp. TomC]KHK04400.1 Molybdenum ABC transporter, periplasmic molybdenum-binding protein ModA [Desulfovibrio sp. TomC]